MGKSTRTSVLLALATAAILLMALSEEPTWGLLVGSWTLMLWGWTGSPKPQEITVDAQGLSPRDVKEYRRQHPGVTMVDAINALGKSKQ
ncbi:MULTISPECIES: hypothetical protein [Micrococcaceae]|uniref:hypothetical protein n=1 Tax=Micrococcaceae TaxID=1268 RepID=UPI000CFBFFB9|nr:MULTISPECIES: hypothetical protein [unclassified Arthrobacter]PQZ89634.1 hypothetical protein CQ016_01870 [Arthrobacter sp. MYb222]PRB75322.1 hypothetical protein CQ012_12390 [Arthrobacter sp. MYb214]